MALKPHHARKAIILITSTRHTFRLSLLLAAVLLLSLSPEPGSAELYSTEPRSAGAGSAEEESISITAVGDIMMGSDFPSPRLPPDGGRDLLTAAAPFFKRSDIALANLEGTLCAGGEPAKVAVPGRSYLFRTPPEYARNLKEAGISMVSLANNHVFDFGRPCFASTKKALTKAGVAFSSKNGEIARFSVRGVRIGVVSLSFGPPPRSIVFPEQVLEEISRVADHYDILILSIHAGAEGRDALHVVPGMERYLNEPRGDLIRFAHDAIDRGADLIVAHGPHVPRAMELYRDRLIAYSLGNFATFGGMSVTRESGYAPLLTVQISADGSFLKGSLHSFRQKPLQAPVPDPGRRALRLIRRLSAQDFPNSPLLFQESGDIDLRRP